MVSSKQKPTAPPRPEIPRRALELPGSGRARDRAHDSDGKQLVVGRDIALSGEIKACERLIVEGTVDAALTGGQFLDILDGGVFKGPAEVREADISGRFEGSLTVSGRLRVRAGGHVDGDIHYGDLEVERGAVIRGTLDQLQGAGAEIHALPDNSDSGEDT